MRKVIMIRGNSGSGKTTIAKHLQREFGQDTMMLSQDTIRGQIVLDKTGRDRLVVEAMISLIEFAYKNELTVIVEGVMNSEYYTPLFNRIKDLYKTRICAYYFDLTREETFKRHQNSDKSTMFGEAEMRIWWKEDYLSDIPEKMIDETMSVEDIAEMIYKDMNYHKRRKIYIDVNE